MLEDDFIYDDYDEGNEQKITDLEYSVAQLVASMYGEMEEDTFVALLAACSGVSERDLQVTADVLLHLMDAIG